MEMTEWTSQGQLPLLLDQIEIVRP
jgi:hypothetical protein